MEEYLWSNAANGRKSVEYCISKAISCIYQARICYLKQCYASVFQEPSRPTPLNTRLYTYPTFTYTNHTQFWLNILTINWFN